MLCFISCSSNSPSSARFPAQSEAGNGAGPQNHESSLAWKKVIVAGCNERNYQECSTVDQIKTDKDYRGALPGEDLLRAYERVTGILLKRSAFEANFKKTPCYKEPVKIVNLGILGSVAENDETIFTVDCLVEASSKSE